MQQAEEDRSNKHLARMARHHAKHRANRPAPFKRVAETLGTEIYHQRQCEPADHHSWARSRLVIEYLFARHGLRFQP